MAPDALLGLWEQNLSSTPPRLRDALATAGADHDELGQRPLGEVQAGLVELWRSLVEGPVEAVTDCPVCGEPLEVAVDLDVLPRSPGPPPSIVDDDGTELELRLLTPADLDAVAGMAHDDARSELVRRATGVSDPSPRLQQAAAAGLEAADPASTWWLGMRCPSCGHDWEEPLDLAAFTWHEVQQAATTLIGDVAELAAAFGWSESAILTLSPARRAAYLERATA
jgi:hypothetical protein